MNTTSPEFDPNFDGGLPPDNDIEPLDVNKLETELEQNVREFSDLINSIDNIDARVKRLWKQIYENAVTDRKNAYLAWADLFIKVYDKADQHGMHGLTLAKYLERMEKSNAQLIRLSELVMTKLEKEETGKTPPAEEFFKRFSNRSKV